jgi:hypothetical protein
VRVRGGGAVFIVVLVAVAVVIAIGASARRAVQRRAGVEVAWTGGWLEPVRSQRLVLAVVAFAAACIEAGIAPFGVVLGLNMSLGATENVPFSMYPMFAAPSHRSYALRFERQDGEPLNIATLGVVPAAVRQRFGKAVLAAHNEGAVDPDLQAAGEVVDLIEQKRPMAGPLAHEQISVVLIEYEFDGSAIGVRRRILAVTPRR